MEGVLVAGGVGAFSAVGLYNILRPSVNCHFCNTNHRVSFGVRNSWTCPSCDQYNGFQDDGDYNRDMSDFSPDTTRYCSRVTGSSSHVSPGGNGLCDTCNLNQEMKINLRSKIEMRGDVFDEFEPKTSQERRDLEDHLQHLESSFKLCPDCQDILDTKIRASDARHGAVLFEHNLSRSKLNNSVIEKTSRWWAANKKLSPLLTSLQFILSLVTLNMILYRVIANQGVSVYIPDNIKVFKESLEPYINQTSEIFPHISLSESVHYLSNTYFTLLIMIMLGVNILISFINNQVRTLIINAIILVLHNMATNSTFTELLCCYITQVELGSLMLAGVAMIFSMPTTTGIKKVESPTKKNVVQPAKMRSLRSHDTSPVLRSLRSHDTSPVLPQEKMNPGELIARCVQDDTSPAPPPPSIFASSLSSSLSLVSPSQIMSPAPAQVKPRLLRSSNESSFNHEFATVADNFQEEDDFMSTLSIGEAPSPRPSSSPFSIRPYSPSTLTNKLFSPPIVKKPLIRPARLHSSWVAGGYWNAKDVVTNTEPGPSRCSSQTSGFISASPSVLSYQQQQHPLYPTPPHSVLSEPIHPHLNQSEHMYPHHHNNTAQTIRLRRRTVDESISDPSIDHDKIRDKKEVRQQGWWSAPLFTMTPERLLIVILACALMWCLSVINNKSGASIASPPPTTTTSFSYLPQDNEATV